MLFKLTNLQKLVPQIFFKDTFFITPYHRKSCSMRFSVNIWLKLKVGTITLIIIINNYQATASLSRMIDDFGHVCSCISAKITLKIRQPQKLVPH